MTLSVNRRESVTIMSNGSKWMGEQPDTIETLLEVLAATPLDPTFEKYGNFAHEETDAGWLERNPECRGLWHVWGNFYGVSHVFNIRGTEADLRDVIEAIRANQATEAYAQARVEIAERDAARKAEELARFEKSLA